MAASSIAQHSTEETERSYDQLSAHGACGLKALVSSLWQNLVYIGTGKLMGMSSRCIDFERILVHVVDSHLHGSSHHFMQSTMGDMC